MATKQLYIKKTDGTTVNFNPIVSSNDVLPTQTGQNGKFLSTNGAAASWASVDALPSQSGQNGKFLTTDGSAASWATVDLSSKQDVISDLETIRSGAALGATSIQSHQDISGKANTTGTYSGLSVGYATSAGNSDTLDSKHASDFAAASHDHSRLYENAVSTEDEAMSGGGYFGVHRVSSTTAGGGDGVIMSFNWSGNDAYGAQIFVDTDPTYNISLRQRNSAGEWTAWKPIITTNNIGSQSVNYANSAGNADTLDGNHSSAFAAASHTHSYLPLSGGSLTGATTSNSEIKTTNVFFGYRYTTSNNAPAFVFDKPGSNYTGIGANGEANTIFFGPVVATDGWTWTTSPAQIWKFYGTVYAQAFQISSDKTLKENIKKGYKVDLSSINPYTFTFKNDEKKVSHYGLIAQDVEKVLPEAVTKGEDGMLSIEYSALVAALIDKVNDLEKQIKELKGE